ncbi:MAG: YggT family protein [Anaerolineales bacterium]|jgi:YggT family protein
MNALANAIIIATRILSIVILADIVISYILDPFHPVRRILDSIVQPMLAPIRRFMPQTGMFDFSPIVLLILVQLIGSALANIIS